jgi:hypothetical protein
MSLFDKLNPMELINTAVNGRVSRLNAKTAAEAQAQDQRTTGVSNEFFQQLQQAISQMDKSVAEKLFGTSNTTDVIKQLEALSAQSTTDQSQTTVRGDAGANNAVLQNIMQLSGQLGNGGEDAMTAAINQTLRSGAGALAGVGNRSGTFGDTTTAILQNDLTTRAAEAGVLAKQNAQTATSNSLAQLMQALQGGQEVTTGKQATATTQDKTNTGTNTSSTATTQDRTAQETATDRTSTNTSGQTNQTTDQFTDFYKDNNAGFNTNNNIIAQLGQNIGGAPATGQPAITTQPLPLPGLPPVTPPNLNTMREAQPTNPLAAVAPSINAGLQPGQLPAPPTTVAPTGGNPAAQGGQLAAVGGPANTQPMEVNPLLRMMDTIGLDPNNPLSRVDIGLPQYNPINRQSFI